MKLTVLASGSGGNATYLESNGLRILIDAGISLRQIKQRMNDINIEFTDIDAIFITHEHGDHIKFLNAIHKNTNSKIYINEETFNQISTPVRLNINLERVNFIKDNEINYINHLKYFAVPTSHDSANSTGFIFYEDNKKLSYFTDTGYFPEEAMNHIKGSDIFILEANYDPELLIESSRPRFLKERIISIKGHLANHESIYVLKETITKNTKYIVFAHRSKECNTVEHIKDSINEIYPDLFNKCNLIYAEQDSPTPIIEV